MWSIGFIKPINFVCGAIKKTSTTLILVVLLLFILFFNYRYLSISAYNLQSPWYHFEVSHTCLSSKPKINSDLFHRHHHISKIIAASNFFIVIFPEFLYLIIMVFFFYENQCKQTLKWLGSKCLVSVNLKTDFRGISHRKYTKLVHNWNVTVISTNCERH